MLRSTIACLLLTTVSASAGPVSLQPLVIDGLTMEVAAKQEVHTPAVGTAERKAILAAVHAANDESGNPLRYTVRVLNVSGDWAWFVADPASADGKNHYEPAILLLRRDKGGWSVADRPCQEADCEMDAEVVRLKADNKGAPGEIFALP